MNHSVMQRDFFGAQLPPNIFIKPMLMNEYHIHITDDIGDPHIYDSVVSLLLQAEEGELVKIFINSFGGRLDSLRAIVGAINMTKAKVIGYLMGEACSAAGALFLHCPYTMTNTGAYLHIHEVSFGTGGKGSDIRQHVDFTLRESERFIRETYIGFLSNTEIEDVLKGKELYFSDNEIIQRLENRDKLRQEAFQIRLNELENEEIDLSGMDDEELAADLAECEFEVKALKAEIKKRSKNVVQTEEKEG